MKAYFVMFMKALSGPVDHSNPQLYTQYSLDQTIGRMLVVSPIFLLGFYLVFLAVPASRRFALWTLEENGPVESLTFVFLCAASIKGFHVANRFRRSQPQYMTTMFLRLFAIGALLVALEEIAWGQFIFGWETPAFWREINAQQETTLHNIYAFQGRSEVFRLAFGLAALLSILLRHHPTFRPIAVPFLLVYWVVVIIAHASLDLCNDFVSLYEDFDKAIKHTSELVEMMIGIVSYLYMMLLDRRLDSTIISPRISIED